MIFVKLYPLLPVIGGRGSVSAINVWCLINDHKVVKNASAKNLEQLSADLSECHPSFWILFTHI